jgi:hypothetical protein
MKRVIMVLAALAVAVVGLASCDDDPGDEDAGCAHCCYCRCTDDTIPVDNCPAPVECLDCEQVCVESICTSSGGGGEGSEPCEC